VSLYGRELARFINLREVRLVGEYLNLRTLPATVTHLSMAVRAPDELSAAVADRSWLPALRLLAVYAMKPAWTVDGAGAAVGLSEWQRHEHELTMLARRARAVRPGLDAHYAGWLGRDESIPPIRVR